MIIMATKLEIYIVTELQTPKGAHYTGGWNFFVPDFNKLPHLFRSPTRFARRGIKSI